MTESGSRVTMPILRIGMGLFLLAWGVDKLAAVSGSQKIFAGFYHVNSGPTLVQAAGFLEILVAIALGIGLFRRAVAWAVLAINAASTVASWRQILDPWGWFGLTPGGTHLFLASIVVIAASVVLVLNADDATLTLDSRFGIADFSTHRRSR